MSCLDLTNSVGVSAEYGSITPYRFAPVYTMCHVGVETLFRPTGGQLLFQLVKPANNLTRNTMFKDYHDILTLEEVDNIMTESNPKSKAVEMYRPMLVDDKDKLSLRKLVTNIIPFGVTSIYQCKDWHKDFMTTVQPVMINGACHVDKTDFTKQDTLRIPVTMCEVIRGRPEDPKHFVYMTFNKAPGGDWRLKFIVTPHTSYTNKSMIGSEGYSLVYPLGIIDYLDNGTDNTSVYMFKPASVGVNHQHEDVVWMMEGFVFNTLSQWRLTYNTSMYEFYRGDFNGDDSLQNIFEFLNVDPGKESIIQIMAIVFREDEKRFSMKSTRKRKYDETHDDDDDDDSSSDHHYVTKKGPAVQSGSTVQSGSNTTIPREYRKKMSQNKPSQKSLIIKLDNRKQVRKIPNAVLYKITRPFKKQVPNLVGRLNNFVEKEMRNGRVIKLCRLPVDYNITVSVKEIFLILAMAFLGRLKIIGTDSKLASFQMNMDRLFQGQIAKLTCLVNYFVKGLTNRKFLSIRKVSFLHKGITCLDGSQMMYEPIIHRNGPGIEDIKGAVFADFANKQFGGGVMGKGAVQEEILLITHPETLLGRLLFEPMDPTSACVVIGAVRVSEYTGYGRGNNKIPAFAYKKSTPFPNNLSLDVNDHALTEIVAFDAIDFKHRIRHQYLSENIYREYEKAVAAFSEHLITTSDVPIATGLWGSGAFAGDPLLKILIQIAASAATNRKLILTRINDRIANEVEAIIKEALKLRLDATTFLKHVVSAFHGKQHILSSTDQSANERSTYELIMNELRYQPQGLNLQHSGFGSQGSDNDDDGEDDEHRFLNNFDDPRFHSV